MVVGETGLVGEGIHLVRSLQPELVVLDPAIPDWNVLTVVRALKQWAPASVLLVATTSNSGEPATAFLGAGATYWFDKEREFLLAAEVIATLHRTLTS